MADKETDEKLWKELQINLRLEAFRFPDNKIYGTIQIIPESSRRLIDKFCLIVNRINRIEFESHFEHFSASGFDTNRKNPSARLEAIPKASSREVKTSKICYFFFTGEVYALSPTINFERSNENILLVIRWYHLGDKYAQKYILCLDDIEIQHIRQKLIDDAFEVKISQFEPGEKHTVQLVARLNNGKETYRSDLIEFIVPNLQSTDEEQQEVIHIADEPPPLNLPAYMATENDKAQDEFVPEVKQEEKRKSVTKLQEEIPPPPKVKSIKTKKSRPCCDHLPHDTFPGIDHYFLMNNQSSSSSTSDNDDDDDDVITNGVL